MRLSSLWLIMPLLFILAGCSPESAKKKIVTSKREHFKGDTAQIFNPAVDILFVVDDSGSMSYHQQTLSNNIDLYTKALEKNRVLDYHVGVTTVSMGFNYPSGKLVSRPGNPLVVTKHTAQATDRLAENLLVGVLGGWEETVFAPVQAALTSPLLTGHNSGFYRPFAHLALVFITDAEDQSQISAKQMYEFMVKLKGSTDLFSAYGVIVPSNWSGPQCNRDDSFRTPLKIEEFLKRVRESTDGKNNFFSLCAPDYGLKLAQLGEDLVNRVTRIMPLYKRPDRSTIVVRYGTQIIPDHPDLGWSFDPSRNALIFGRDMELIDQGPNVRFEVLFHEADDF